MDTKPRDRRGMSFRTRLTASTMASAAVPLLLACTAFIIYDVTTTRQAITRDFEIQARIMSTQGSAVVAFRHEKEAAELLATLSAEPQIVCAVLYLDSGKPLARYLRGDASADSVPPEAPGDGSVEIEGGLGLTLPVVHEGDRIGTLFVQSDFSEVGTRLTWSLIVVAAVLVGALMVAYFLTLGLGNVLTRPVLSLAETARRVSHNRIHQRTECFLTVANIVALELIANCDHFLNHQCGAL